MLILQLEEKTMQKNLRRIIVFRPILKTSIRISLQLRSLKEKVIIAISAREEGTQLQALCSHRKSMVKSTSSLKQNLDLLSRKISISKRDLKKKAKNQVCHTRCLIKYHTHQSCLRYKKTPKGLSNEPLLQNIEVVSFPQVKF